MGESRGCIVVLLGPNGSGKTTLANAVMDQLQGKPFERVSYHHSRGLRTLPKLGNLRPGKKQARPNRAKPRGTPGLGMVRPTPLLRAMVSSTYYAIEMLLSRRRLSQMKQSGCLVIFDRYYYDYFYDRASRRLPWWFLRALCILVPQPDLTLFIERDAKGIHDLKPELTIEEITTQQARIRRLLDVLESGRVIDASAGVEEATRLTCNEIEAVMAHA